MSLFNVRKRHIAQCPVLLQPLLTNLVLTLNERLIECKKLLVSCEKWSDGYVEATLLAKAFRLLVTRLTKLSR